MYVHDRAGTSYIEVVGPLHWCKYLRRAAPREIVIFACSQAHFWVWERDLRHVCALRRSISRWKGNVS